MTKKLTDNTIECRVTGQLRPKTPEELVRQDHCRLLMEVYGYPKSHIGVEFPISWGRSKKRADIVVFRSADHRQDNAYIIIETKQQKDVEGIEQVESYATVSSAAFAVWTNGPEIRSFKKENDGTFSETPDIPTYEKSLGSVGHYLKSELKPCLDLKRIFDRCNNYFYVNQGLTQDKRFTEIVKLMFAKIQDEKNVLDDACQFYITADEHGSEAGMKRFRARIEKLYGAVKAQYRKDNIFEEHDVIRLNDRCLGFAVAQLMKFSLLKTDLDLKGLAFETFVGANLRGEHGEFFTPREVVKMAVEMIAPQPNEVVLDPACGSGGFLVYALGFVRSIYRSAKSANVEQLTREYADQCIRGIDFNPDLARVAKMNMVLNDDGHTGIFHHDSLTPLSEWPKDITKSLPPEGVDIIFTNPPFGEKCKVDDPKTLANFDLAHKWVYDEADERWVMTDEVEKAMVPDVLFVERCLELLKPGGRMAIVLPDGILGNLRLGHVRQYILDRADLLGIVDCPVETFQPSVDTKTSVLLLKKKTKESLPQTFDVFMAVAGTCGHDRRGNVIYKRDDDGNIIANDEGEPIIDNDLDEIAEEFRVYAKAKGILG